MNIIQIVIDGLRADHLSCCGYHRPTSPTIDSLATNGVLFENFFTPVTPTQPSMTTVFTGQSPSRHRIIAQSGRNSLDGASSWFPENLRKKGYVTVSLDSLPSEKRWFARGFDVILAAQHGSHSLSDSFRMNDLALQSALRKRSRPFYLFLHYFHTHTPYTPDKKHIGLFYRDDPTSTNHGSLDAFYRRPLKPDLITDWLMPFSMQYSGSKDGRIEDIGFIRSLYDEAIRTADDTIAQLLDRLRTLGLLDDTVLIIHGDHGQELGEHGIYFEQHGLYDSTIRIPLIISWPQGIRRNVRVSAMHQTIDIAPTILDLIGCSDYGGFDGRTLMPALVGTSKAAGYSSILAAESTWMAKWAYRTDSHKLIVAREQDFYGGPLVELYDLVSDPGESINIAETNPVLRDSLAIQLESEIARRGSDVVKEHGIVRSFDTYYVEKTLREFRRPALSRLIGKKSHGGSRIPVDQWNEEVKERRYPDFRICLEEFGPMIGSYAWQLKLLRKAAARTGGFPQQLYRKLRRLIRRAPSRPFFVTTSANGVLFLGDFRDSFSVACAVVPKYNEGVISALTESVLTRPGGFVDVGANAGIVAASVALNLRGISNVYAIEAEEQTARRAAATFALNRLTNVRLYHCAAGNHDGRGTLYSVPQASAIASLRMTDLLREHSNVMTTPTSVRTLDSLAEEFRWDSISLLKVDVEGQEYAVLRGAAGLINRHKPTILYENNPMTLSDDPAAPSGPPDLPGYQKQSIPGGGILRENGPAAVQSGSDILCIPRE